ncbi:MAG TPA: sensor histidine kinase [Methanomicrobiales archaeon]|nr:sensor histidine kinase [Methanomicrobiales archaeon]
MKNPLEADIFRKISQTQRDLVVIFIIAILVFSLSVVFNLPEMILGFIGRHNSLLIGNLLTLAIVLVLALAFFSYRRWQELEGEIQERKEAGHALLSANRQLQLLNDITRHDIINSLTGLFLLLGRSEAKAAGNPELLAELQKEKEIAELIHRQIAFTRDYQEIGLRRPEWQNVEDIITKAWIGHKIGSVRIDARVHGIEIFADLLLEKVFYNLIDNAMKYGGPGMTTIRFFLRRDGDSVVIICEDDGLGISEEVRNNLFRRGYGKHTGYGLFMIREILGISGLTITENGRPGSGARFEILVPRGLYRCTGEGT